MAATRVPAIPASVALESPLPARWQATLNDPANPVEDLDPACATTVKAWPTMTRRWLQMRPLVCRSGLDDIWVKRGPSRLHCL